MHELNFYSLYKFAKKALQENDRETAKKVAEYIVANDPDEYRGWLLLAGLSRPDHSIIYLEKARAIAPDDIRIEEAYTWAKQRFIEEAPTLTNVLSPHKSLIEFANRVLKEGDQETAKKVATFMIDEYPDAVDGWLLSARLSSPDESLSHLYQAICIAPKDPRVIAELTWAKERIKELSKKPFADQQPPEVDEIPEKTETPSKVDHGRPDHQTIPKQLVVENRNLVLLWALIIIVICGLVFFGLGVIPNIPIGGETLRGILFSNQLIKPTIMLTPTIMITPTDVLQASPGVNGDSGPDGEITQTITPTEAPLPAPNLYGCAMEITFVSGPLAGEGVSFTMLDETYFEDKAGKFLAGRNTAVYYREFQYVIMHSGYLASNINFPLEAEFIRLYLESWGLEEPGYIADRIQELEGSEMVWVCEGRKILRLRLEEIARLSRPSSVRLWLEPHNIPEILEERQDPDEWIGDISTITDDTLLLNICGWGPPSIREQRSLYYRYLLRFEIIE